MYSILHQVIEHTSFFPETWLASTAAITSESDSFLRLLEGSASSIVWPVTDLLGLKSLLRPLDGFLEMLTLASVTSVPEMEHSFSKLISYHHFGSEWKQLCVPQEQTLYLLPTKKVPCKLLNILQSRSQA